MATSAEIRSAYRHEMRLHHPDMSNSNGDRAAQITLAYAVLSDAAKKRSYDYDLERTSPYAPTVSNAKAPASHQYTSASTSTASAPKRTDPVTNVAPPMEFHDATPPSKRKNNKRASFFTRAWSTIGGKIALSLTIAGFITWVASASISLSSLAGTPVGLSGLVSGILILTVLVFIINPVRHPWLSIVIFALALAIPIDHINKSDVLPNFLEGLSDKTTIAITITYLAALGTRLFFGQTRQIAKR
jgi:hypothetical protein